jgi:hypothetical protein
MGITHLDGSNETQISYSIKSITNEILKTGDDESLFFFNHHPKMRKNRYSRLFFLDGTKKNKLQILQEKKLNIWKENKKSEQLTRLYKSEQLDFFLISLSRHESNYGHVKQVFCLMFHQFLHVPNPP